LACNAVFDILSGLSRRPATESLRRSRTGRGWAAEGLTVLRK